MDECLFIKTSSIYRHIIFCVCAEHRLADATAGSDSDFTNISRTRKEHIFQEGCFTFLLFNNRIITFLYYYVTLQYVKILYPQ